jgi:ribosomal protein S3
LEYSKDKQSSLPLKGILVKVKGRINGAERSRIASYRYGSIPLHTIDAPIDYGFATTQSSYGVSSIKFWLSILEGFHLRCQRYLR